MAKPKGKAKPAAKSKARSTAKKKAAPKKKAAAPKKKAAAPKKKAAAPKQTKSKAAPGKRAPKPKQVATTKPAPRIEPKGGGEVVRILDSADPIGALRAFLDDIQGGATVPEGQVALGSAQLMLLPIAREGRGGPEVKELLDLVLGRWTTFPDRTGFHAQEFLRNAFAAVGNDRERIARLTALVPIDASPELRFNVACALAVVGERDSMLRAIEAALASGASATSFRTDDDFAPYRDHPGFLAVLERAAPPPIPVDIGPHVPIVRASLESAVKTLREFGEVAKLDAPATLDAILSAERAGKIQLPNDYRALLTLCDGLTLWDHTFFGTVDYRNETELAKSARRYLEQTARYGRTGIDECVPLANWGQPNDWLLYDPHGRVRGGAPGYVLMLNADECPLDGLAHALDRFERIARDVLGTN